MEIITSLQTYNDEFDDPFVSQKLISNRVTMYFGLDFYNFGYTVYYFNLAIVLSVPGKIIRIFTYCPNTLKFVS